MTKQNAAVYVALITAIGGLTASLVNRFDPSEPMAESSYQALKPAFEATSTQVESLTARVFRLETLILRMNAAGEGKRPKKAKKAKNKALKKISSKLPIPETTKRANRELSSHFGIGAVDTGVVVAEAASIKPPMTESTPARVLRPWSQQQLPSFDVLRSRSGSSPVQER